MLSVVSRGASTAFLIASAAASPAVAQVTISADPAASQSTAATSTGGEQAAETDSDRASPADIVVTGTSIRGVAPVGSPVIGITERQMTARGATSVTEAIRQVPQIFNLGTADTQFGGANNANANRTGGTGINLRGLSPEATLVLLDSRRVPLAGGGNSSYFDPSVIPTMALERIEVMADGGSAIYGADAVGGVVNLLTRRRYDGAMLSARYGLGDDIDQTVVSGIVGTSWGSGWVWIAGEYNYRSRLRAVDRSFYTDDLRPWGGPDLRPILSNPGTIRVGTTRYALPANQNGVGLTANRLVAGTANFQSRYLLADALPEQRRYSFALRGEQELAEGVTLGLEGFASHRKAPRSVGQQTSTLTVPRSNPFFVHPTNPAAASVTVDYSFIDDFGPSVRRPTVDAYFGSANLAVDLGGTWKLLAYGSYGENREDAKFDAFNNAALARALADTNPATALNPFGDGSNTSPATLAQIFACNCLVSNTYLTDLSAKADGSLFTLPAGDVRVALGTEYQHGKVYSGNFRTDTSPTNQVPITNYSSAVDRNVISVFAEAFVPVTASDSGFGALTLSAAGRHDHYSDFGNTFNPKFGFTWNTHVGLTLRGSYGTSYRAPVLNDLNEDTIDIQAINFVDSAAPTGMTRVIWVRGANANLQPETATLYSLGADYKPDWLPGFSVSTTYFNIDYTNRIEAPGNDTTILNKLSTLGEYVQRPPAAAAVIAFINDRRFISGAVVPSTIEAIVDGKKKNSGKVKLSGFDLLASYRFNALNGTFEVGGSATYLINFDRQLSPRSPLVDILDTINNPLSWQARGQLTYDNRGGFGASAFLNYAGEYRNDTVTPNAIIKPYATLDLAFRYDVRKDMGLADGLTFTLDIKNATGRQPPYVQNGTLAFDPQVADMVGRFFLLGVQKRF